MKALVVYFSHSGKTRSCAEALAKDLGADIREIRPRRPHRGILTYILGVRDAVFKKKIELDLPDGDFTPYDTVVLATPVWASNSSPAMYSFASCCDFSGKKVVALFTHSGCGAQCASEALKEVVEGNNGIFLGYADVDSFSKTQGEMVSEAISKVRQITS